jgi:hypothetical protein
MFSGGGPDTPFRFLRESSFHKCVVTEAKAPKHRVNLNAQGEDDWRSAISVRGLFMNETQLHRAPDRVSDRNKAPVVLTPVTQGYPSCCPMGQPSKEDTTIPL